MSRSLYAFIKILWIGSLTVFALVPVEFSIALLHKHREVTTAAMTVLQALGSNDQAHFGSDSCEFVHTIPHCMGVATKTVLQYGGRGRQPTTWELPGFIEEAQTLSSPAQNLTIVIAVGLDVSLTGLFGYEGLQCGDMGPFLSTIVEQFDMRDGDVLDAVCFTFIATLRAAYRNLVIANAIAANEHSRKEAEKAFLLFDRVVNSQHEAMLCNELHGHIVSTPNSHLFFLASIICPSLSNNDDDEATSILLPILTRLAVSVHSIASSSVEEDRCWLSPTQSVGGLLLTSLVATISFVVLSRSLPSLRRIRCASDEMDALLE